MATKLIKKNPIAKNLFTKKFKPKVIKPKKAYLTHISHMLGFHDEVQKILPENVFLAYDGLEINI